MLRLRPPVRTYLHLFLTPPPPLPSPAAANAAAAARHRVLSSSHHERSFQEYHALRGARRGRAGHRALHDASQEEGEGAGQVRSEPTHGWGLPAIRAALARPLTGLSLTPRPTHFRRLRWPPCYTRSTSASPSTETATTGSLGLSTAAPASAPAAPAAKPAAEPAAKVNKRPTFSWEKVRASTPTQARRTTTPTLGKSPAKILYYMPPSPSSPPQVSPAVRPRDPTHARHQC